MTELIIKMVTCLVIALLIGLVVGWLLAKVAQSKKHLVELDILDNTLNEKNADIEMLEKQFSEKETVILRYENENNELKELLAKKSNDLIKIEEKLITAEESLDSSLNIQKENKKLQLKITQLDHEVNAKTNELEEFETVLIKAEETIANKMATRTEAGSSATDEKLKNRIKKLTLSNDEKDSSIALYQKKILELENELKPYLSDEEDDFIVTKDQFTHIEKQLIDYQDKIKELKEENNRLVKLSSYSEKVSDNFTPDEMDDVAIVKLFRETYKKITKS